MVCTPPPHAAALLSALVARARGAGVTSFDTSEWEMEEGKAKMVGPFDVECGGLQGKYVTLRLPGEGRLLTISEISVYGAA